MNNSNSYDLNENGGKKKPTKVILITEFRKKQLDNDRKAIIRLILKHTKSF